LSELIALRRADFFEILRKEPGLAVKLLWQFLGVLADRLEQTSRDLQGAREELAAEDITDAIFPEGEDPIFPEVEDSANGRLFSPLPEQPADAAEGPATGR